MSIWDLFKKKPAVPPTASESPKASPIPLPLTMSPEGRMWLKGHESCELAAYPDPLSPLGQACMRRGLRMRAYKKIENWDKLDGGPWTIGYGNTASWVKEGTTITQHEANDIFNKRLDMEFAPAVRQAIRNYPLKQHQFDAIVSLTYNIGTGAFSTSTCARNIREGRVDAGGDAIMLWTKNKELVPRRDREYRLFVEGVYT